jgi:hypothetical protein
MFCYRVHNQKVRGSNPPRYEIYQKTGGHLPGFIFLAGREGTAASVAAVKSLPQEVTLHSLIEDLQVGNPKVVGSNPAPATN